jgi:dTDP-D-glucose 4,6-dehydratase
MILVTGGAGFIGANFVLDWLAEEGEPVVNLDALTYAGNLGNLASAAGNSRHVFVRGNIGDKALVGSLLANHRPRAIVNPRQFPEKLIPLTIVNALAGKPVPVYGDGQNVRDWLYVGDHCAAIRKVLALGRPGATYNAGGNAEMKNIDVVRTICTVLSERRPGRDYLRQIAFVRDRPGHDRRYAIDATRIRNELGWTPSESFASGIRRTIGWYLDNEDWLAAVMSGAYHNWVSLQYAAIA